MREPHEATSFLPDVAGNTLAELVHARAAQRGNAVAYTFFADGGSDVRSITWSQLDERASALGASLRRQGAQRQPVLLALTSGLPFIESLFACWYAGAIAVPVSLPRHQRVKQRLQRIVADASARFVLGLTETRLRLDADPSDGNVVASLTWIDPGMTHALDTSLLPSPSSPADPALLQYTSGSTGAPRGVVVSHKNLMSNSALIAEAGQNDSSQVTGGWLPLYHDMGLVGMVLQGAYIGAPSVFMAPERFLMRPWQWLQMISDYRIASSPAPNFAYELCIEKVTPEQKSRLDLSCWKNALNGSECVRSSTLDRFAVAFASCGFRREAFAPCYGLAEATLFVSGQDKGRRTSASRIAAASDTDTSSAGYVSCGRAFGDTQLAIVDPDTRCRVAPGKIGEVWVAGESCAQGYWHNPAATAETFNVHISGLDDLPESDTPWLRTGDLGFMVNDELFVTGRLRELIIIYGRNYFPVDLEYTVEAADPAIASSSVAAFSVDLDGAERLIIAAEVRREFCRPAKSTSAGDMDLEAIRRRLRTAIIIEHEVTPHEIVLLRPGALPRTTSGKLSRKFTHDAYLSQTLERLESSHYAHADA